MDFFRRRETRTHLNSLDGIRAFSVIAIIVFHAYFLGLLVSDNQAMPIAFSDAIPLGLSWIRRGYLGVDIFFVLSAFLISSSLFREESQTGTLALKQFYLKRFLRIYPIYMVALLILSLLTGWSLWSFSNVFALNNMTDFEHCVMPWSWSLASEIQFYLSFPLVLFFFRHPLSRVTLGLLTLVASFVWMGCWYYSNSLMSTQSLVEIIVDPDRASYTFFMQHLYIAPLARIPGFIFGIVAGWLWVYRKQALMSYVSRQRKIIFAVNVTALIGCLAIASFSPVLSKGDGDRFGQIIYDLNMIFGHSLFALLTSIIMLLSIVPREKPDFMMRVLGHTIFYPVSRGSYAMYLFHPIVMYAIYFALHGTRKLEQLTLPGMVFFSITGVLGSFMVGIISYYAVEKWTSYQFLFRPRVKQDPQLNPTD